MCKQTEQSKASFIFKRKYDTTKVNGQRNVVSFQMIEIKTFSNIPTKVQKRKYIDKIFKKANEQSSSPSVLSELFIVFVSKYRPEMHLVNVSYNLKVTMRYQSWQTEFKG